MGAFAGATRSGAALCAVQVFSRRENLDAGRIQFARADEGVGAPGGPWPAGASAGTQAEDALTMKRLGAPGGPWPAGASAGTQAEDALTMKRLYQAACG